MPSARAITTHEQFEDLIKRDKYTVIKFFAKWCPYCKDFGPVFKQASKVETFSKVAEFHQIDCSNDEQKQAQRMAGVNGVPHVGIFFKGKLVKSISGHYEWRVFKALLTECFVLTDQSSGPAPPPSPSKSLLRRASSFILERARLNRPSSLPIGSNGNVSRSSLILTTVSTRTTMSSTCTGVLKDKTLGTLSRVKRFLGFDKPFSDPEPNCVLVPSQYQEVLQIGRANHGRSFFSITLGRPRGQGHANNIHLGIEFCADSNANLRFSSASLRVAFGFDYGNPGDLPPEYLIISDMSPKDEHGKPTKVHFEKGKEGGLEIGLGHEPIIHASADGKLTKHADFTRETSSWVHGHGVGAPHVDWMFKEDEGHAGRHGLNPHYELSVTLSLPETAKTRMIWVEFFGEAVLSHGHSTFTVGTLKMGSMEAPWRRNLPPSAGVDEGNNTDSDSSDAKSAKSVHSQVSADSGISVPVAVKVRPSRPGEFGDSKVMA